MKRTAAIVLLLAMLFAALPAGSAGRKNSEGMSLSGFSACDICGEAFDGSIFGENTLTVLNVWMAYCGPCMFEMPFFLSMRKDYMLTPEADVELYGVLYHTEAYEIAEAQEIVVNYGYDWTQLIMDPVLAEAAMASPEGYVSTPQTMIVDRRGVVRAHVIGKFEDQASLDRFVADWLSVLTAEEQASPGDVDLDGSVTVSDALAALRMALGLMDSHFLADIDMDGEVTISDALLILRTALGI